VATNIGADNDASVGVDCPGSAVALGGGGSTNDTNDPALVLSAPLEADNTIAEDGDTPTGWFVDFDNVGNSDNVTAYAICAS
jgi:hypothetical protein